MTTSPALYATWLGYLTVILALAALALALAALLFRREALERWAWWSLFAVLVVTVVATIVALAAHTLALTATAIYTQFFLAATLFTLAAALADWRGREAAVLWEAESRVLYLTGLLGCAGLAIVLVGIG